MPGKKLLPDRPRRQRDNQNNQFAMSSLSQNERGSLTSPRLLFQTIPFFPAAVQCDRIYTTCFEICHTKSHCYKLLPSDFGVSNLVFYAQSTSAVISGLRWLWKADQNTHSSHNCFSFLLLSVLFCGKAPIFVARVSRFTSNVRDTLSDNCKHRNAALSDLVPPMTGLS